MGAPKKAVLSGAYARQIEQTRFNPDDELNKRDRTFCAIFHETFNGTLAATKAGYAASSASQMAVKILERPKIRRELRRLQELARKRFEARSEDTVDKFVDELKLIAMARMGDYVDLLNSTDPVAELRKLGEKTAAIASITVTDIDEGKRRCKIKLWEKPKALVDIARSLGLFDRHPIDPDIPVAPAAAGDTYNTVIIGPGSGNEQEEAMQNYLRIVGGKALPAPANAPKGNGAAQP